MLSDWYNPIADVIRLRVSKTDDRHRIRQERTHAGPDFVDAGEAYHPRPGLSHGASTPVRRIYWLRVFPTEQRCV